MKVNKYQLYTDSLTERLICDVKRLTGLTYDIDTAINVYL